MLLSMTGFGQGLASDGQRTCTVEIRALNSRSSDYFLKTPPILRGFEIDIRKMLSDLLIRGKVEVNIQWKDPAASNATLDLEKISAYWVTLRSFANNNQIMSTDRLLAAILQLPDVSGNGTVTGGVEEWALCQAALQDAISATMKFREREGEVLQKDILEQLDIIESNMNGISPLEKERVPRIRERIQQHAESLLHSTTLNPDRLEQEMVYYIEKLDINEEMTRLKMHIDYFREVCLSPSPDTGKKLGFLSQELGREINTIGSKANDAGIQKFVILMKEALEKIKEQLANIL